MSHFPGQVEPHCQRAVVATCEHKTRLSIGDVSKEIPESESISLINTSVPKYTASRLRTVLYKTLHFIQ